MIISKIKKMILKSVIKDIKKELTQFQKTWLDFILEKKGNKDELLDFCKKKLKEALEEYIKNYRDKEN